MYPEEIEQPMSYESTITIIEKMGGGGQTFLFIKF